MQRYTAPLSPKALRFISSTRSKCLSAPRVCSNKPYRQNSINITFCCMSARWLNPPGSTLAHSRPCPTPLGIPVQCPLQILEFPSHRWESDAARQPTQISLSGSVTSMHRTCCRYEPCPAPYAGTLGHRYSYLPLYRCSDRYSILALTAPRTARTPSTAKILSTARIPSSATILGSARCLVLLHLSVQTSADLVGVALHLPVQRQPDTAILLGNGSQYTWYSNLAPPVHHCSHARS